jgi:hypothetical protein
VGKDIRNIEAGSTVEQMWQTDSLIDHVCMPGLKPARYVEAVYTV